MTFTAPSPGPLLRWLGGNVDVRVEVNTGLGPESGGLWEEGEWDDAVWGSGEPGWFDLSPYVMQVDIDSGNDRWGQRYQAGSFAVLLDNTSGIFTQASNVPKPFHQPLIPNRLIRAIAVPDFEDEIYLLFTGFVDDINDSYADGAGNLQALITASDALAKFNRFDPLALETPTGVQRTDERVNAALNRMGWPDDADHRDIQEGEHTMQSSFLAWSTLEECQRAADAEGGAFFISPDGKATFKNRDWLIEEPSRSTEIQGAIGYPEGESFIEEVVDTFDADDTWIAPEGVTEVTVEAWGGGGGGSHSIGDFGGGGGGGGAYARSVVAVTPNSDYDVVVGEGGPGWTGDGGDSTFAPDGGAVVVKAAGGQGGWGGSGIIGGDGGLASNSTGDTKFNGGTGADGDSDEFFLGGHAGGGGGGSATATGAGGNGSGRNPGSGEGDGGRGADSGQSNEPGEAPGGGGGGGSPVAPGGNVEKPGADGRVRLTYALPLDPPTAQIISIKTSRERIRIRNKIMFARTGSTVQTSEDGASQSLFDVQSYQRFDFENNSDDEIQFLADRYLEYFKSDVNRVEEVTLVSNLDEDDESLNELFYRTLFGDLLSIQVNTQHGWSWEQLCQVRRIIHRITANDWQLTLGMDEAVFVSEPEE